MYIAGVAGKKEEGDPELIAVMERYNGQLISPGGAAAMLGVSRQTIHKLGERGKLTIIRSSRDAGGKLVKYGPRWALIPLEDVQRYGEEVGRQVPRISRPA